MGLESSDYVLVPLGIGVLGIYHIWLVFTIRRNHTRTVIGLNAETRRHWVSSIMADPLKNGVLAVQTIRNNIMTSSLLATTAITLCSLISVYVSNTSDSINSSSSESVSLHGTTSTSSVKESSRFEDSNLQRPLLTTCPVSTSAVAWWTTLVSWTWLGRHLCDCRILLPRILMHFKRRLLVGYGLDSRVITEINRGGEKKHSQNHWLGGCVVE